MFQEIRSIVLEENRSQKHYRRNLGLVRNIIPSATSLRGVYAFQHTSNLTNLSLTLFLAHLAVARVIFCHRFASIVRPSVHPSVVRPSVRRPSIRPSSVHPSVVRPSIRPSCVRRKLFIQRSSPLKLLGQLKQNLVTMVLRWPPFKIVSGRSGSNPRFTD
jgi:hypothetical protein